MAMLLVLVTLCFLPFSRSRHSTFTRNQGLGWTCDEDRKGCLKYYSWIPSCVMLGGKKRCALDSMEPCSQSERCSEGCCSGGTCDCNRKYFGNTYCGCSYAKRQGEVCVLGQNQCGRGPFGFVVDGMVCMKADNKTRCSTTPKRCPSPGAWCVDVCCFGRCKCTEISCRCRSTRASRRLLSWGNRCDQQFLESLYWTHKSCPEGSECVPFQNSTGKRCIVSGQQCTGEGEVQCDTGCCAGICNCETSDCYCQRRRTG